MEAVLKTGVSHRGHSHAGLVLWGLCGTSGPARKSGFSWGRAWRMMNFRQRMGWIGVGLYLLASAAAFYYVFEINETYSRLALEHIQQHPRESREGTTWTHAVRARLLSLPFWLWVTIFLVPYVQMFLFLYSCTRADPKTVGYCIIPVCLAVVCNRHQTFVKASNQISRLQLIDT
ncbi:transmembrane protein 251 isoform X1 [Rhinatrema bivittatum]|uniref:transmembrane protein 251 isoform X1 n=2 Tax=Rhinatrema bivittatum TaxID=194408 RepID=UPI00112C521F|nr:transmembrane protein 251 isoform X1 [Rhinatrema bivittatum]